MEWKDGSFEDLSIQLVNTDLYELPELIDVGWVLVLDTQLDLLDLAHFLSLMDQAILSSLGQILHLPLDLFAESKLLKHGIESLKDSHVPR